MEGPTILVGGLDCLGRAEGSDERCMGGTVSCVARLLLRNMAYMGRFRMSRPHEFERNEGEHARIARVAELSRVDMQARWGFGSPEQVCLPCLDKERLQSSCLGPHWRSRVCLELSLCKQRARGGRAPRIDSAGGT